jgi:hypothetical protein
VVFCSSATHVVARIPPLLQKHPGCARISVYARELKLFSVDHTGCTLAN